MMRVAYRYIIIWVVLFILSCFFLNLHAQNEIRSGDKLNIQQLAYFPLDTIPANGQPLVWNFSGRGVLSKFVKDYFIKNDKSFTCNMASLCCSNISFFMQDSISLKLVGLRNHTTEIIYDVPPIELSYPINKAMNINGYFSGKGMYGDHKVMKIYGSYHTSCPAVGTLITLNEDTISNVLLIHSQKILCNEIIENSQLNSIDSLYSYILSEIPWRMSKDTSKLYIDDYKCYAQGFRYPILESQIIKNMSGKPLYVTSYYISPEDQSLLNATDSEKVSKMQIKSFSKSNAVDKSLGQENLFQKNSYSYKMNGNYFVLEYSVNSGNNRNNGVSVNYGIYDIEGKVYYSSGCITKDCGIYHDSIDLTRLKPGVYLFSISIDGKKCINKITKD